MNSLAALLEQFSLSELTRVLRRTVLSSIALAAIGFVVAALLSAVIFAWGLVIGFVLGLLNIRLITAQTAKVGEKKMAKPIRALASLTLARLAITTVIVIGLAIASTALGLGVVAGIAVFYFMFLLNLIVGVLRHRGAAA
jgi:hypothetical protein